MQAGRRRGTTLGFGNDPREEEEDGGRWESMAAVTEQYL